MKLVHIPGGTLKFWFTQVCSKSSKIQWKKLCLDVWEGDKKWCKKYEKIVAKKVPKKPQESNWIFDIASFWQKLLASWKKSTYQHCEGDNKCCVCKLTINPIALKPYFAKKNSCDINCESHNWIIYSKCFMKIDKNRTNKWDF